MGGLLLMALAVAACSPEEFDGSNSDGAPSAAGLQEGVDYIVNVNQETNEVTFTLNMPGYYPIWTIEGVNGTTTVNSYRTKVMIAGTYGYSLQIGNRNGISDGTVEGTYTVNTTRFDFSEFYKKLCGDGTKEWRISSKDEAHLACGEAGTDGTNWWKAGADEKISNGVYDDRITFSLDGKYTYNPGEDGLVFCNKGVSVLGHETDPDNDYDTHVEYQETTYSLVYNPDAASEVNIVLPANTLFPYMSHDDQYNNACEYIVNKITDKKIDMTIQMPDIAWHFILINGEDEAPSQDFDPNLVNWCDVNSDQNLATGFNTAGAMSFWWANADWQQTADPGFDYADGIYTITAAVNGGAEWQAQNSIVGVAVNIEAEEYYDISVDIESSANIDRYTLKICKDGDDDNILFYNGALSLTRGNNTVRFAKRIAAKGDEATSIDIAKWIFDFGGTPEGTVFKISNFIIQKHNPK
ncbi:MAG: hypothetical protein NC548_46715 [Lachnospiraceae bacterium]|nr:hypothetical protein [Lachnospiraceae bacterium]